MHTRSATLSRTPTGTLEAAHTIMGRHRHTGLPRAQQAALLATGAVTSHRRARSSPWARSAVVLAVGVLASGVVITAATTSWFQEAALPQSRAGEPAAEPADRPVAPPGAGAPAPAPAPSVAPTATSAPSTPAAAPAAAAPAATLWRADDDGAFRPTPRHTVGTAPPQVVGRQVSVHLTGRGQRSELEPDLPALGEGDRHDVTFSLCLSQDFPVRSGDRQVIARWENDGPGSAPLDLRVRDGALVLHGGEGHPGGWRPFDRSLGPVPTGQWVDVALRVHFSANPDKAQISAWRDGERVLSDHHPRGGTLYPGQQSYLKVGLHRDAAIAQPAAVHFRDVQIVGSRTPARADRETASSGSTSGRPDRETASSRSTSGHPSVPQQRSSSSSAPKHRAAERGSTQHESAEHESTQQRSTQQRSTQQQSSESASPRASSHGTVPRNTPSQVGASHGGSTGSHR
jgi:hypothetical protein